ncbi:MAG TPA: hypothetical protein VKR59_18760 [Terriglobales bacterium]|nr:hypothetical protein [Terriglobales bacterium]
MNFAEPNLANRNLSDSNLAAPNLADQWTVYRTRFLVRARQLTEPLVFTDSLGREQSGRPGDYLVETAEGVKRITSRAIFEDIYVPLESGSGILDRPASRATENRLRASA